MGMFEDLKKKISNDIDDLSKAEVNKVEAKGSVVPANEMIGSKALIDDPYYDYYTRSNFYKQKGSRLSNTMLKTISLRDWLVSAILQIRCDTMAQFGRIQENVFDTGFKIEKYSGEKHYNEEELKEVHFLENFILHCGRVENTPVEDQRTFDVLLKLCLKLLPSYNNFKCPVILSMSSAQFGPIAQHVFVGTPPNSVKPASVIIAHVNPAVFAFPNISCNSFSESTLTQILVNLPSIQPFNASSLKSNVILPFLDCIWSRIAFILA